MKYTPAYDGEWTHKKISLSELTPCVPFDNLPPDSAKRTQKRLFEEVTEKEVRIDKRLLIKKLCDALILGARRGKGKGWYRKSLGLGNE